ncbi:hypothetical protein LGN17_26285 [Burkholderia sp. AU30280]|uniref:hypothetical protein n=1 Tax=Burkholderia sp. AU30280 TaxID=2879628 RepID=UPI001CF1E0AD|nr:hypothetical protein [Burkholderia sp. AU30280]MCA8275996.1 hypothetical protein [Burkholderia sp. AU30280]
MFKRTPAVEGWRAEHAMRFDVTRGRAAPRIGRTAYAAERGSPGNRRIIGQTAIARHDRKRFDRIGRIRRAPRAPVHDF